MIFRLNLVGILILSYILAMGQVTNVTGINIIPRPNSFKATGGHFVLSSKTTIRYTSPESKGVAQYLSDYLSVPMGTKPKIGSLSGKGNQKDVIIVSTEGKELNVESEEYELMVSPDNIMLKGQSRKGLFYGVQSLLQLMPVEVFSKVRQDNIIWSVPCVEIKDAPALSWRGYMLDVSRHFFSKETVFRQIDLLALYKINRFHLHLTDDQGWRVEIKKYPRLTEIGAWQILDDGKKQGGFYTQKDLIEIVEYARQREIMIIPEIDMPGHSLSVISAYPELSCRGAPVAVRTRAGVSSDNMCPSNDQVYDFVSDILDEIVDIFPAPYIHIGGDEAQKSNWLKCPRCLTKAGISENELSEVERKKKIFDLQDMFVGRVNEMILDRGKRMIGWDEIIENEAIENIEGAVIQSWRSAYPGLMAAEKGHQTILSPGTTFYLDYPNGQRLIDRIYNTVIPDRYWRHYFDVNNIIGVECALWTETVATQEQIDYLTWPRMLALAELGWTDLSYRSYGEFKSRLMVNEERFDHIGVNYQKISGEKLAFRWRPEDLPENEVMEYDITGVIDQPGQWEVVFVYEGGKNGLKTAGFEIVQHDEIIARCDNQLALGWRDQSPVNIVDISEIDPNKSQTFRIRLLRDPESKSKAIDGIGSVWFTRKKHL